MRYKAFDELNHFSFHDAALEKIDIIDGKMIWQLSALNATIHNSQNSFDKDMCIERADIIFDDIIIDNIVFGAYEVYDSSNVLVKSVEAKIANPEEYNDILKSTGSYCYILSMEELPMNKNKRYQASFNIDGGAGNYDLFLSFSKSIVQWDEYSGEAWYEDEKWKKK